MYQLLHLMKVGYIIQRNLYFIGAYRMGGIASAALGTVASTVVSRVIGGGSKRPATATTPTTPTVPTPEDVEREGAEESERRKRSILAGRVRTDKGIRRTREQAAAAAPRQLKSVLGG